MESYLVSQVPQRFDAKKPSIKAFVEAAGDDLGEILESLQNALTKWKSLYSNFVTLMRHASKEEILAAIANGYPDPSVPIVHPSETAYPICEAAKRGDADIVAALIAKGVRVDVVGIRSSGGCGVGSLRKATPLAEALLAQHKEVSLLLAAAHPSLATDEGYVEKSFEGDEEHKPLEIAEEWGDEDVIAAIKAKL